MPSPMQNIESKIIDLEAKIDIILAKPALPPETPVAFIVAGIHCIHKHCVLSVKKLEVDVWAVVQ